MKHSSALPIMAGKLHIQFTTGVGQNRQCQLEFGERCNAALWFGDFRSNRNDWFQGTLLIVFVCKESSLLSLENVKIELKWHLQSKNVVHKIDLRFVGMKYTE